MSLVQVRQEIVDKLEELDEKTLHAVHTLLYGITSPPAELSSDEVFGYEIDGTPITKGEIMQDAVQQIEEVRQGKYTTLEEWKKETEAWLNSIE